MTETVSLSALRFGHNHPTFGLNSRVVGREADPAMVGSLREDGLLTPPLVWIDPELNGELWTLDGNRRLDGMHKAHAAGDARYAPTSEIEVTRFEGTRAQALKVSLATHVFVAPLHPVDRYETFNRLIENGVSEREIAESFSLKPKEVRKALALGAVAKPILEAWRAGKIEEEVASAFTLEPDKAAQASLAESLGLGKRHVWRHAVVEAIVGEGRQHQGLLAFVGKRGAKAGGVEIVEDLFENTEHVKNPDKLAELAEAKLQKEYVEPLTKEGWGIVAQAKDIEDGWRWAQASAPEETGQVQALEEQYDENEIDYDDYITKERAIEAAAWQRLKPEERAGYGIFLTLTNNGEIRSEYRVKPKAEKASSHAGDERPAQAKKKAAKQGAALPSKVIERIREDQTKAMSVALQGDAHGAMTVLIATLLSGTRSGSPLCIEANGLKKTRSASFAKTMEKVVAMTADERVETLAELLGGAVDCTVAAQRGYHSKGVDAGAIPVAARALDQVAYLAKVRETFSHDAFFAGAPKAQAVLALTELLGEDEAKKVKGAKDAFAAAAVKVAKERGWLPEVLRTDAYREEMGITPKTKAKAKPRAKKVAPKAKAKKAA